MYKQRRRLLTAGLACRVHQIAVNYEDTTIAPHQCKCSVCGWQELHALLPRGSEPGTAPSPPGPVPLHPWKHPVVQWPATAEHDCCWVITQLSATTAGYDLGQRGWLAEVMTFIRPTWSSWWMKTRGLDLIQVKPFQHLDKFMRNTCNVSLE